jgi:multidrug efflux pump subunit AcrB
MWIVELALRRPLSVAVMALLMLVLGVLSFAMMNVDIFPAINLPVVLVIYNYPGLSAIDMERRIILISERADSTTVNGIDHIESESFEGIGLKRIYFQPGTDMGAAIAQLNATAGTIATVSRAARSRRRSSLTTQPTCRSPSSMSSVTRSQGSSCSTTASTSSGFSYSPFPASLHPRLSGACSVPSRSILIRPRSMRTGFRRKTSATSSPRRAW